MANLIYPSDYDCGWLAVDSSNEIGIFITAGIGPIPICALRVNGVAVEDVEEHVLELPKVCDAELLVSVPAPDSYIELAARGIYVFDWLDIHRTRQNLLGVYEAVAIPSKPMKLKALPLDISLIARATLFKNDVFLNVKKLDVGAKFDCLVNKGQ